MINFIFVVFIFGQSSSGFEFLRIGVGSRAMALGNAYTALANEPFGVFYNPAGINSVKTPYLSSFYGRWFMDTDLGSIIGAIPFGKNGVLAFGLRGLYTDKIELRSEEDPWDYNYYSAYFTNGTLNYARRVKNVSIGLSLNGIATKIETASGYSTFLSAGGIYHTQYLDLGLSLSNIGLRLLDTNLPITLRAGVCIKPIEQINLTCDILKSLKDDITYSIGMEVIPIDAFKLRIGYDNSVYTNSVFRKLSAGLGLNMGNIGIDYTVSSKGIFGLTHLFTLSYHFVLKKVKEEFVKEKLTSETYVQQGIEYYNQRKYDEALNAWDLALIWYPENREALDWIEKTQGELKKINIQLFLRDGRKHFENGKYLEAVYNFEKVLDLDPNIKEADSLKIEAERRIKEGISQQIKVKNDNALKAYKDGDYLTAVKFWKEILQIEPNNTIVQGYINETNQKMVDEIKNVLDQIKNYITQGNLKKALTVVTKMLKKYPGQENLSKQKIYIDQKITDVVNKHLNEGRKYFNAQDYAKAESEFQAVLEYDKNNTQALLYLDRIRKQLSVGKKEEAERYYLLGISAYTKNNFGLAIDYWKKVLELAPSYPNVRKNLERAQIKLKELSE